MKAHRESGRCLASLLGLGCSCVVALASTSKPFISASPNYFLRPLGLFSFDCFWLLPVLAANDQFVAIFATNATATRFVLFSPRKMLKWMPRKWNWCTKQYSSHVQLHTFSFWVFIWMKSGRHTNRCTSVLSSDSALIITIIQLIIVEMLPFFSFCSENCSKSCGRETKRGVWMLWLLTLMVCVGHYDRS